MNPRSSQLGLMWMAHTGRHERNYFWGFAESPQVEELVTLLVMTSS